MKRQTRSVALIFGVTTLFYSVWGAEPAAARTWTDTQGRKVEAEFAGVKDGVVQLKTESGKIHAVPVEQLSSEDRRFVATEMGVKPAAAPAAAPEQAAPAVAAGDANDRFSEAIRQNPQSADAYYQRGLARLNRKQSKEALADFNEALKLDPQLAEAYDGRGQAHSSAGDPVSAAKDFDKAIELKPDLASAYQHRGDNLKELSKSDAGRDLVDEKIEAYRKMYQVARDKQLTDKAWQPLNSTSGPTTRAGMIGQMARADYEKAKQLEGDYRAGKGSGSGYGSGKGSGPGKEPKMASKPKEPKEPKQEESPEPPPSEPESGVIVIPEKVAKGENVVLVADPDKLAAGLPHEAKAGAAGNQSEYPAEGQAKSEDPSADASKSAAGKPAPLAAVDFYRDKDGDGKLDINKDELLASDVDPQDGYSAEVSTANFPVGKQTYFAVPKMAAAEKASDKKSASSDGKKASDSQANADGKTPADSMPTNADETAAGEEAGGGEKPTAASKADEDFKPAEPVTLASAAVSGSGEVVEPEQMAAAEAQSPPEKEAKPGKGKGKGKRGKGGGSYAGPRDSKAARAVERALGYAGRNDYAPAITEYNNLLTDYVDDPYYLNSRAGVHLAHGGYDLAIRDYNRLIEVETHSAEIYYNRGCAYLSVGNLPSAIADFSESLKLDELGKFANLALNNRGTAYARQGRFDLALVDFESAIKLNANDAVAYRNRSLALRKLGRVAEADADLVKSKQLGAGA